MKMIRYFFCTLFLEFAFKVLPRGGDRAILAYQILVWSEQSKVINPTGKLFIKEQLKEMGIHENQSTKG